MVEQLAVSGALVDGFSKGLYWLTIALLLFKAVAFIDAAIRRPAAYQAVDKQTKTFWLLVLAFAVAVDFLPIPYMAQMLSLIGLVAAIVYMVDVRPRVRAITPRRSGKLGGKMGGFGKIGRSKKDNERNHMGPYGPW
ncbi:DUF2516 family protein [Streptacidiphilus sp. N1-12]|uniref:DUF2516 family protein n=2 Tax=Streptacidiphilus alkalitolerans TaxID=3342712 RepID=A0ABV6WBT4_9ACTN